MKKRFLVLGSGRWGSAMAIYLVGCGHSVFLACREENKAEKLRRDNCSDRLPSFPFPPSLIVISDVAPVLSKVDLIIFSTPVSYLRETLLRLKDLSPEIILIGINKGIDKESLQTPPQIIHSIFPQNPCAHLGGPCFPAGLICPEFPVAETLACADISVGKFLQGLFSSESFRVYLSRDVEGVAFLGALKNIYAIAAGMIQELNLSEESLSILLTRALAELKKFCRVMSISEETLYGLSGLGDLALTCYSLSASQNKEFGVLLVRLGSCNAAFSAMNFRSVEGYHTLFSVRKMIFEFGLDMPIAEMIYCVVYENFDPAKAILALMNRPLKFED